MLKTIFIKLGGSLITDKSRPYTPKMSMIRNIAKEIKTLIKKYPKYNFILGNGGGSFPHTSASRYKTAGGYRTNRGRYGACVVENDAVRINRIVVQEMLKQEIPAVGINPSSIMLSGTYISTKVIQHLVENNIIPVVFGDVIFDENQGCRIFSCDEVIEKIAKKFKGQRVIISMGDYKGVMDEKGSLIKKIDKSYYLKLVKSGVIGGSRKMDVTGGMKAKIATLLRTVDKNAQSAIIDGRVKGNLLAAIAGKSFVGTIILTS